MGMRGLIKVMISTRLVEYTGGVCEELASSSVALSNFAISDSSEDRVSFCILVLDLYCRSQW